MSELCVCVWVFELDKEILTVGKRLELVSKKKKKLIFP